MLNFNLNFYFHEKFILLMILLVSHMSISVSLTLYWLNLNFILYSFPSLYLTLQHDVGSGCIINDILEVPGHLGRY